jgi:hypothetical protein
MRIFISYRREDSAGHTGRLFDSLRSHFGEKNVFLDLSGIDSGRVFTETIQEAIRSADVVLAIIGREWLTCARNGQRRLDDPGDLVRTEITTAFEQQVPVIPVLVDGTPPPAEPQLPVPLRPLARRDAHDITDERWDYDVERLITMMERLAGSPGRQGRRRWLIAAAVVGIVAALGAGAMMYWRSCCAAPVENRPVAEVVPPAVQMAGSWTAPVAYPWGVQMTERFAFTVDRNVLTGTASFLGVPRGLVEGTIDGDRIRFETRTGELGSDQTVLTHRYRGRVSADTIDFTMQTERGGIPDVEITFTASRVAGVSPR